VSAEDARRLRLTRRHLAVFVGLLVVFSVLTALVAGGALGLGFLLQVARSPATWRLWIWGLAWVIWLGSGLVSFLHAFS